MIMVSPVGEERKAPINRRNNHKLIYTSCGTSYV